MMKVWQRQLSKVWDSLLKVRGDNELRDEQVSIVKPIAYILQTCVHIFTQSIHQTKGFVCDHC